MLRCFFGAIILRLLEVEKNPSTLPIKVLFFLQTTLYITVFVEHSMLTIPNSHV